MFRRSKPPARKSAPKKPAPQPPPQPRPGPIIVGYMRISTDEQVLDLQRQALLKAGATVLYQDEGISGAVMDRPGLHAALADLHLGDTCAVWKLDRLGRRAADLLAFLTALEERGVRFRSITEGFDTSAPAGRAMLQMVGVFAEFERETLRERVTAGRAAARRNGQRIGRPPALKSHQRDHARDLFLTHGKTKAEIARILGVGRSTVQRHLRAAGKD